MKKLGIIVLLLCISLKSYAIIPSTSVCYPMAIGVAAMGGVGALTSLGALLLRYKYAKEVPTHEEYSLVHEVDYKQLRINKKIGNCYIAGLGMALSSIAVLVIINLTCAV